MKIGYIRISTADQNTARQELLMEQLGVDEVYIDRISGKNTNHPELQKMMEYVRRGDTVIVESISRFARNTRDLLELVEQLSAKGVEFVCKKEAIDTTTPTGKFMLTVFGAVAELEREYILQRQREGIAIAKDNPKLAGKTGLKRLIQDGEELTIFSIKQDDLKGFQMESKRYGVLFYPIVNKVEKTGTVEIMAKAKDAKQINRIFERMGYPAPVQSDARKQRPRAPSENSFRERGSGARTSTEMDKPSVREKVKALKAELEAARRREPVIPVKENDLAKRSCAGGRQNFDSKWLRLHNDVI